jgi:hypothetical protein
MLVAATHLGPLCRSWHIHEADAAALHGNAPGLLIITAVQVAQLTNHLGVDQPIGGNEVI